MNVFTLIDMSLTCKWVNVAPGALVCVHLGSPRMAFQGVTRKRDGYEIVHSVIKCHLLPCVSAFAVAPVALVCVHLGLPRMASQEVTW